MKCIECGEAIEDGGSASIKVHDFCCSHENVVDIERDCGIYVGHCDDCGGNVIDAGVDGSWDLQTLWF